MSTARAAPGGRVFHGLLPTGPHGRPLCRYVRCRREVSRPAMHFCGPPCVHGHKLLTDPGYLRDQVHARDHGVCAACRADTDAILTDLRKREREAARAEGARVKRSRQRALPPAFAELLRQLGYPEHRYRGGSLWDADHVLPVAQGGGECDLANMQTLCCPCHRRKSGVQRRAAAKALRAVT